jgi:hypothetical protein
MTANREVVACAANQGPHQPSNDVTRCDVITGQATPIDIS